MADDEFVQGYRDGRDPDAPEPSGNRSHSYRHSFNIRRREMAGDPINAGAAREAAAKAEELDRASQVQS